MKEYLKLFVLEQFSLYRSFLRTFCIDSFGVVSFLFPSSYHFLHSSNVNYQCLFIILKERVVLIPCSLEGFLFILVELFFLATIIPPSSPSEVA